MKCFYCKAEMLEGKDKCDYCGRIFNLEKYDYILYDISVL